MLLAFLWCAQALAQSPGVIEGTVQVNGNQPVWVYVDGEGPLPTTPATAEIGQTDRRFEAPVLVVVQGTTVDFMNHGPGFHNIYSASPNAYFNLDTYPAGQSRSYPFDVPGEVPVRCNLHAEMKLEVLVVPNLWYTQVGKDGTFRIPGVTPGSHTIVAWNPNVEMRLKNQVVKAGATTRVALSAAAAAP